MLVQVNKSDGNWLGFWKKNADISIQRKPIQQVVHCKEKRWNDHVPKDIAAGRQVF